MPERQHPHYDDLDIINVDTSHEKSDVNVRALLWTAGISIVIGVISYIAIWYMFRFLEARQRQSVRAAAPLTAMPRPADVSVPKDQPLLQPFPRDVVPPFGDTPVVDLQKMRFTEERALTTYGWVDQQKGIVRIPIDEAKKIALQRGFPVQSGGQASPPVASP